MENHRHSRVPILKSFVGAISPINAPDSAGRHRFRHPPLSPIIYPYAFDISDSPSPLMNYLCSSGPAVVGAATVFVTPLKVEEDVLVMDGIPVPKTDKGSGARIGSNLASLNLNSTTSQQGGIAAENGDSIKAEFCRHWKDSGTCRFGSNCQFAHSTEELHPPGLSAKSKLESFKPYNSSNGSNSSSLRRKSSPINQIIAASTAAALLLPIPPTPMASTTSTVKIYTNSGSITDSKGSISALLSSNWSPLDDGVEVILPLGSSERRNNSCKEDLEAKIQKVLYCTGSTKRLPVFLNICAN